MGDPPLLVQYARPILIGAAVLLAAVLAGLLAFYRRARERDEREAPMDERRAYVASGAAERLQF